MGHGVSPRSSRRRTPPAAQGPRRRTHSAWIFALETFRGRYVPRPRRPSAAVDGGDTRVSFVDTTGWLGSGDLTDSVHPNDQGHRVIADRLAPIIAARIGM